MRPINVIRERMMKKLLLSLLAITICLSFNQCKSKEDRANELIKDYMFKSLYDFGSYEPIETKFDSAFHTIYTDSTARFYAYYIFFSKHELDNLKSEYESIKTSVDIWCDGNYYSSYSHKKCQDCLDEAKDNLRKQFFLLSQIDTYRDSIIGLSDTLQNEFIGWQVSHDFRCKTKGGSPDIGHYVFIMDKDVKTILSKKDLNDKEAEEATSIIKETLEMTEEERAEIKEILRSSSLNN